MVRKYLHRYPLPRHLLNSDITSSLHNQTSNTTTTTTTTTVPSGKPGDDPSFDSNMVIILAGLLCALICALGLNSIVRCALRCSRRFPYENSEGRRLGSKGVTKDDLRRIPVVAYETGINAKAATDCAICLTEFEEGERVRVLPECDHGFHVMCIDTWLRSNSSCPICRQPLSHHSATKQSSS